MKTTTQNHPNSSGRLAAFSLVEVVMAIGIVAFAIMGVVAMLPVGLKEARNATEEIRAANLSSLVAEDLKSLPSTNSATPILGLSPLPGAAGMQTNTNYVFFASDAGLLVSSVADARYRITLRYTRNVPLAAIEGLLVVSWPPGAAPFASSNRPLGQVETYLTFVRP